MRCRLLLNGSPVKLNPRLDLPAMSFSALWRLTKLSDSAIADYESHIPRSIHYVGL
jgi:hypothetical protein